MPAKLAGGRIEVLADGDVLAGQFDQAGQYVLAVGGATGSERGLDIPIIGGLEVHLLALAVHDEPCGHRLDAAGGELAADLVPEDRRHLVAVQPVEDAAGLLSVDQPFIFIGRVADGLANGVLG